MAMKQSISKERIQMEDMERTRKAIGKSFAQHKRYVWFSVKGIAGASVGDIPLLDGSDDIDLLNQWALKTQETQLLLNNKK